MIIPVNIKFLQLDDHMCGIVENMKNVVAAKAEWKIFCINKQSKDIICKSIFTRLVDMKK